MVAIVITISPRNINGFLNTGQGGKILLGVLDDGTVAGLALSEEQVAIIVHVIYVATGFSTAVLFSVRCVTRLVDH